MWSSRYQNDGVRDLFVELPYYTAEYMNLWMKSDNDDILDLLVFNAPYNVPAPKDKRPLGYCKYNITNRNSCQGGGAEKFE